MTYKFATAMPLFNTERVAYLQRLDFESSFTGRMLSKWNAILAVDNTYEPQGPIDPWDFPPYYDDPEASIELTAIIRADAEKAVDLGLRWRVRGDPADAEAVVRILTPWTGITIVQDGDSRLTWSNKWPMFIQAAQLVSDSEAYTPEFEAAMKSQTLYGLDYTTAWVQTENRAAWGLVLNIASAGYLNDRDLFDRSIERWRELFDNDIDANIPTGETARGANGLYYCNFWLNAMTQAAELARFYGEWLYDYESPDGSTLMGVWETVAHWTAVPEDYSYWPGSSTVRIQAHVDPLHALWPNSDSQALIDTYTTTQDYFGFRQGMLAYRDRPLYG
jgi:hypothetical protein